ncbi:MAG: glycosyltransferase family 4 protein [Thermoanaerobaculales bacterium]
MKQPLRVCIDARILPGVAGGVEQVITGLASGLAKLADGDEEYLFLVYGAFDEWLRPFLGERCRVLRIRGGTRPTWKRRLVDVPPGVRRLIDAVWLVSRAGRVPIPRSDGFLEAQGAQVVHFCQQSAFLTEIPSIYHPHDLQHVHLPQLFSGRTRKTRDIQYRAFCSKAKVVSVVSSWVREDLVATLGVPREKIAVIPLAPPISSHPQPTEVESEEVRRKYSLPDQFAFYPAQTWPHKNHIGLLEAAARIRSQDGLTVPLVFSGQMNGFHASIAKRVRALGLSDSVLFVGYVSSLELSCLYKLCRCVIVPTKFEAASFPVWEAFAAGRPVACSKVTSLPEQAGDAALLFDPDDYVEMAGAIRRLWTDEALLRTLARRGAARVATLSWEKTAKRFRAHYRALAGEAPCLEDQILLRETWQ